MSLNDRLDKMMARHVAYAVNHAGERGQFIAKGDTTGSPVLVSIIESPSGLVELGNDLGHQSAQREATIALPVDAVASPAIDDAVTIARGVYAGTWTIISIDSIDAAVVTVRARLVKARRSNAAGSRMAP